MAERYDYSGSAGDTNEDCPYAWISEWLCEYVDGTMDPSMQAVFEEYLEANPELEAHVERLCRTRTLLSECGCQEAADRAKVRLRRVSERASPLPARAARPTGAFSSKPAAVERSAAPRENDEPLTAPMSASAVVAVASAMTLMLGVGMATGAFLFADPAAPLPAQTAAPQEQADRAPDRPPAPSRALGDRTASSSRRGALPWTAPPASPLYELPAALADTTAPATLRPLVQPAGLDQ